MKTRSVVTLLLLFGLALLVACSSNEAPSETTPSEPAASSDGPVAVEGSPTDSVSPAEAPEDAPSDSPEPVAPAETPHESTEEPEPVEPDSPDAAFPFVGAAEALDGLSSYRYQSRFTFVGEDDGEPESGSIEISGSVVAPDRQHITWTDLSTGETFELIQIGTQAWIHDEEGWQEIPALVAQAMTQAVVVFAPSVSWAGLYRELEPTSTYVGEENLHGISTRHYTSTYRQWAASWPGELTRAAGDVWIAEAGYPVRYSFSATGVSPDGEQGAVAWSMDLFDVDQPITIESPL